MKENYLSTTGQKCGYDDSSGSSSSGSGENAGEDECANETCLTLKTRYW